MTTNDTIISPPNSPLTTGNVGVVRRHIDLGTAIDEQEPSGRSSPLITAVLFCRTDIARVLLMEAEADVNFQNNEGSTPLHTAAFFGRTEIVELLHDHGADISIKTMPASQHSNLYRVHLKL